MITKKKLRLLVCEINEITNNFHLLHEYRGKYKLYVRNSIEGNKDVTAFMIPRELHSWMTAYVKGLKEGKMIMLAKNSVDNPKFEK